MRVPGRQLQCSKSRANIFIPLAFRHITTQMFKPEFRSFYASKTPAEVSQNTDSERTAKIGSKNSRVLANTFCTRNLLPAFKNLI